MKIDPAAVVRARPVIVALAGREYQINARPAADWLSAILEQGWPDIVPGMLDKGLDGATLDGLYDELTEWRIDSGETDRAAQEALTAVAGIKWWAAVKLIHAASGDAAAIGELRLSGVDLAVAPLGAVVAGLYRIYTRDRESKDITKFDTELMRTPPGVSAEERYDEQDATDAFERAFSQRGGR